jgi:hypothetical protein
MAETAALLVDEVLPRQPVRRWVLSLSFALRYLLATRPEVVTQVLGVVYRAISGYLIRKAGVTRASAVTGAVTRIQRFGSALSLNVQPAPDTEELKRLVQRIAERIGCSLERSGLITRDIENAHLAFDPAEEAPINALLGASITYRIATGPREGQKVFTLQTLPAAPEAPRREVAESSGFSLHAGIAAKASQRDKLEHLARYVSRPPVATPGRSVALMPSPSSSPPAPPCGNGRAPVCGWLAAGPTGISGSKEKTHGPEQRGVGPAPPGWRSRSAVIRPVSTPLGALVEGRERTGRRRGDHDLRGRT